MPVPQIAKETVEAVRVVQRERMQQRTVDATTPRVLEETVEVGRLVLHERVQQRTAEQFEDAPQNLEEAVEAVTSVPRESEVGARVVSERHRLVTLGVCFRMWTWLRRKFG